MYCDFLPKFNRMVKPFYHKYTKKVEARAGIEPAFTDLQSAASPFCHRAPTVKPDFMGWNQVRQALLLQKTTIKQVSVINPV